MGGNNRSPASFLRRNYLLFVKKPCYKEALATERQFFSWFHVFWSFWCKKLSQSYMLQHVLPCLATVVGENCSITRCSCSCFCDFWWFWVSSLGCFCCVCCLSLVQCMFLCLWLPLVPVPVPVAAPALGPLLLLLCFLVLLLLLPFLDSWSVIAAC